MTERNPICISSGHGLKIRGASGSPVPPEMDEVDEVRKIVDRVFDILTAGGVTVYKFHDNTSTSSSQNLSAINAFHNSKTRDLDVSVHLNATEGAYGTEVLYITQEALARDVSKAIATAGGFTDRGPKYRSDLSFLNGTDEPAILLECWFCDSKSDCDKARTHFEAICQAIATSIAGKALGPGPSPPEPGPEPPPDEKTRPVIGLGDYGNNVAEVQVRLGTSVDGSFGPGTEDAVISFQRTSGLQADGVVGVQDLGRARPRHQAAGLSAAAAAEVRSGDHQQDWQPRRREPDRQLRLEGPWPRARRLHPRHGGGVRPGGAAL